MFASRETSRTHCLAPDPTRAIQSGPPLRDRQVDGPNQIADTGGAPQRIVSAATRTTTTNRLRPKMSLRIRDTATTTTTDNHNPRRRTSTWWRRTQTPTRSAPRAPPAPQVGTSCTSCRRGGTTGVFESVTCPTMLWPLPENSSSNGERMPLWALPRE